MSRLSLCLFVGSMTLLSPKLFAQGVIIMDGIKASSIPVNKIVPGSSYLEPLMSLDFYDRSFSYTDQKGVKITLHDTAEKNESCRIISSIEEFQEPGYGTTNIYKLDNPKKCTVKPSEQMILTGHDVSTFNITTYSAAYDDWDHTYGNTASEKRIKEVVADSYFSEYNSSFDFTTPIKTRNCKLLLICKNVQTAKDIAVKLGKYFKLKIGVENSRLNLKNTTNQNSQHRRKMSNRDRAVYSGD